MKTSPCRPVALARFAALGFAIVLATLALSLPSPAYALPTPHSVATLSAGLAGEAAVDRATPRRALQSFLDAARAGDFTAAAHCLDLRGRDPGLGPELAEELSYVLYRRAPIDLAQVPDEPVTHDGQVAVDTFVVGEEEVPFLFVRIKFEDGIQRWVVARSTVRRIPDIAATVRTALWEQHLPRALRGPVVVGNAPWQWIGILLGLAFSYAVGRLVAGISTRIGASFARRTTGLVDDEMVRAARKPLVAIVSATTFGLVVYGLQVSLVVSKVLVHFAYTGFILGFAWLLLAAFSMVARVISPAPRMDDDIQPDLAGARTRRALLQRVASAAVVGVTTALLLLQFDVVRHVGLSLLASAGIAGVVLGLAAQKSLAGVIAGIQLSITQPIRLGDTIFIDGETGVVQDIFLTYAVIRYWDDRCVVVPLSRFLEQPFQNWTLLTHDVSGVVLLHVKFTAPVEVLREKARALCEAQPRWDKRRCELQVGDSDMYGMVLRVMISARSPAESFELRCAIREGLIVFLQQLDGGVHMG